MELVARAQTVATARIAYVEARAAFARARREGRLRTADEARAVQALNEQWPRLVVIELDADLADRASEIVSVLPVRAADAIHLAAAEVIADTIGEVTFACWDMRLWEAAHSRGFRCVPERL